MNNSSHNKWVKAGNSYKASPDQKSWDVLRMRLENKKLKGHMTSLRKWSVAAVSLGILSTLVFMFDKYSSVMGTQSFALQNLETSGAENSEWQSGTDIYNMTELKNLKDRYEAFGSDEPL